MVSIQYAYIEHRWLRVYRKRAKLSEDDMAGILHKTFNEPVSSADLLSTVRGAESGETLLTWTQFRVWIEACGHRGCDITYYYLPYRNRLQRLWDRVRYAFMV